MNEDYLISSVANAILWVERSMSRGLSASSVGGPHRGSEVMLGGGVLEGPKESRYLHVEPH